MEDFISEGSLKDVPFPEILYKIYKSRDTGVLRVEIGEVNKSIYISEGNPIYVKSNLLRDTFGRFLLRNNKISKKVYEESLRSMVLTKRKQGEILMEMGYIRSSTELYELLSENIKDKILHIFSVNDGICRFTRDEGGFPDNILHFNLSTIEIIIKGINERFDIENIKINIDSYMDNIPVMKDPYEFSEYINIDDQLISIIDGKRPLKEIIEESNLDKEYVYKTLYILLIMEGLDINGERNKISKEDDALRERFIDEYMNMKSKNYFEILGVSEDASTDEIKRRYFSLAKDYHPDKYFNKPKEIRDIADEIFTMIAAAYNTLIDDNRREEYISSLKVKIDGMEVDNILNAELQFQKGKVYLNKKDYEYAVESFEWACKLNPNEAEYHAYLGWAIFKKSLPDYKQSISKVKEILKKAIELNPGIDKAHYFLGLIYKTEDNIELAEKEFKKAVKCNPEFREALQELRIINLRKEKKKKEERKGFLGKIFK
jgi:curved DNA-binding protein CbpA